MTSSNRQEKLRRDLHNELQLRYREFFESKLAIDLLKQPTYFPSVRKISAAIATFMVAHENTIINLIKNNDRILAELREPYFGSCYDEKQAVTAEEAFKKMLDILTNKTANLKNAMQIHCIFIHRIYDNLEKKPEKAILASKLFPNSFFSPQNRGRTENKEEVKATTQLGISKHPVFSKMLETSPDKKHSRAIDRYTPDSNTAFFKSAEEKNIPIVCGASGHIGSLLLGAKLYGDLTSNELNEYALAGFSFLTAGGNHSFYEIAIVAKLIDAYLQPLDYSANIALSASKMDDYIQEYLHSITTNKEHKNNLRISAL